MSGLARDETAEPVSRDQILRREREQGSTRFACSADHEQDWQSYTPADAQSAPCIHTFGRPRSCATSVTDRAVYGDGERALSTRFPHVAPLSLLQVLQPARRLLRGVQEARREHPGRAGVHGQGQPDRRDGLPLRCTGRCRGRGSVPPLRVLAWMHAPP